MCSTNYAIPAIKISLKMPVKSFIEWSIECLQFDYPGACITKLFAAVINLVPL
jgi:hypothetical protein